MLTRSLINADKLKGIKVLDSYARIYDSNEHTPSSKLRVVDGFLVQSYAYLNRVPLSECSNI